MKSQRRLYKPVKDGEWVQPVKDGYRLACCDCGLVHVINLRTKGEAVEFQAFREAAATKRMRKRMGVTVDRQAA